MRRMSNRPLVCSCSGCSNLAQLANDLTLRLCREGLADMYCTAGIGTLPSRLDEARDGRPLIALDGCPQHCAAACLARHGLTPHTHLTLSEYGLRRRDNERCSAQQSELLYEEVAYLLKVLASQRA
ncbi:putative zinc-binding protein [Pseudomonas panipatensis]|uniref:Uncharacterized protein, contains metal-binding DGC domain n=1 Tax=Pseudomonas panipatensis TaxID=428992 RepID=A0A1G8DZY5_9PSED|nr:Uncharacterized protein, contains metal-binding DGC domain [Pseudomonas panipatensis]SMP39024.1 Uncharacterized protein, contains metal-binding DGC domain [Pseudomonas panipatensis]